MNNSGQDVLDLIHLFPQPADDFDPLQASAAELASHGLPARPDASREPEAFEFWRLMLSSPLQFITPQFTVEHRAKPSEHPPRRVGAPSAQRRAFLFGGRTHREGSRNWSGMYITPKRPNVFTSVTGSWHVPEVSVPQSTATGPSPINDQYRSSVWIGIDGHRRLPFASLPQIGTGQVLKASTGHTTTGAWWQWWVNGLALPPVDITNLAVAANDCILATVTVLTGDTAYTGDGNSRGWLGEMRRYWRQWRTSGGDNSIRRGEQVLFHIKNQTSGLFATFSVEAPTIPSRDRQPERKAAVSGTTAEWIVERPMQLSSIDLYPLPRYTDVTFRHCMARSVPVRGGGAPGIQGLDNARLIKMYQVFEQPHRTAFVSIPERTDHSTARISYREAPA